jgi:hypothetical protein
MRMRRLGKGQTVVFSISREIRTKILECTAKDSSSDITVEDVLRWSIAETHSDASRGMPLWAVQGERFLRQEKLWKEFQRNGQTSLSKARAEKFLENEAQSLDDRYRPSHTRSQLFEDADLADLDLRRIAGRCSQFDGLAFNASTLQEEQERELSPEIEQERQVQRAPPAQPAPHSLHPDVVKFATTGVFLGGSKAFLPAFVALQDTSAAKSFSFAQIATLAGGHVFSVTVDYIKTVKEDSDNAAYISDVFLRPVQWLLSTSSQKTGLIERLVVISPYEANQLYKRMKSSTTAALHLYKPRCNSAYASLDQLDFHTISAEATSPSLPRELAIQLNLFAGQLYINSYDDYKEVCKFLGLCDFALTDEMSEQGWKVAADGFIVRDDKGRTGGTSGLQESPTNFLKILLSTIRRNGDSIAKTDMGRLLEGKLFRPEDFEA